MRPILTALGAAIAIVIAAAACSSGPATGTETFSGTSTSLPVPLVIGTSGVEPTVPLKATGVFTDTGSIAVISMGETGTGTLHLSKGDLKIGHFSTNPNSVTTSFNEAACSLTTVGNSTFKVMSGTGSYEGYTGNGTYKVTFSRTFAKPGGKCPSQSALQNANPVSALTTFTATGNLTS